MFDSIQAVTTSFQVFSFYQHLHQMKAHTIKEILLHLFQTNFSGNGSCHPFLLHEFGGYWAAKTISESFNGWHSPTQTINRDDSIHGNKEPFLFLRKL